MLHFQVRSLRFDRARSGTVVASAGLLALLLAACQPDAGGNPPAPTPAAAPKAAAPAPGAPGTETAAQKQQRLAWWTDARFGVFIHWGLYAVPAGHWNGKRGYGEWIQEEADIPDGEYQALAKRFNPVRFDADAWARDMKAAGARYVIFTSKHHEGFPMWDTATSQYSIARATPYGKGVITPLAQAARRHGLHFGVYYSIMDWHHGSQSESKPKLLSPSNMDPARKAEYVAYMKAQLRELIEQTDTEVLWFDGEWVDWWTRADADDLVNYLHKLKPGILVNNRVFWSRGGMAGISAKGMPGDFGTPEKEIPPGGLGAGEFWETCMTMNNHWGHVEGDPESEWKSTRTLVRQLIDAASKGGNYLLNVGPTAQGEFPLRARERLHGMGRWMQTNGEAIYASQASPFAKQLPWGRVTRKPGKLYLHVFDWPADGRLELPWTAQVHSARLLAQPATVVPVTQAEGRVQLRLPRTAPDALASVIVLDTDTGAISAGTGTAAAAPAAAGSH